jgi:hypothetical protein
MLRRGGIPLYTDLSSVSCEHHNASLLPQDSSWMAECEGKAVKILDPLTYTPPSGFEYRFIWMRRNYEQQALSQIKFLKHIGIAAKDSFVTKMAISLIRDEPKAMELLNTLAKPSSIITIDFEKLLVAPIACSADIAILLELEYPAYVEMSKEVVLRHPDCYPGMMEISQLEKSGE